jgi:hypothetical protein
MKMNLAAIKAKFLPTETRTGNNVPLKDMGVLDHIEKIVEISGNQIKNIARKTEVDDILNGKGLFMETLVQYCKAELVNELYAEKEIGFNHE